MQVVVEKIVHIDKPIEITKVVEVENVVQKSVIETKIQVVDNKIPVQVEHDKIF